MAVPAVGQDATKPAEDPAAEIKQKAAADVIEPQSIAALEAMGAYLAGLKTFKVKSDFESQMALDNDQVIEIVGTASYEVRRPDGLRARVDSEFGSREFIYDGKQLTVVDPIEKVYGRVEVEPTIKQMLEQVSQHLGVQLPLSDLFNFGTPDSAEKVVTEGFLVSDAKVNGVPAKHWAYRTDGPDFEVWIKDGSVPEPVRIVIVDDTLASRPRFAAALTWQADADVAATEFEFSPPADFEEIGFVERPATAAEGSK